jgi:hypothetical protein
VNIEPLGRYASWMIVGVITVAALGVAVGHTVVSRDVRGFDCGSPLSPTDIDVVAGSPTEGIDRLRAAQCDHELDKANAARIEALIFMAVAVSILLLTARFGGNRAASSDEGAATNGAEAGDEAEGAAAATGEGQAESEP